MSDPVPASWDAVAAAFTLAERVSQDWLGKVTQTEAERRRNTRWMPFPLYDFGRLLLEAWTMAPDRRLLEIGCGPGPDMILAAALGWDAYGIEVSAELAHAAASHGLNVMITDALAYNGYGGYGAVWFNRPLRDRELQRQLEAKVWAEMRPGAVAICANLEHPPPSSWIIVDDSWADLRCGAWVKPHPVPDLGEYPSGALAGTEGAPPSASPA